MSFTLVFLAGGCPSSELIDDTSLFKTETVISVDETTSLLVVTIASFGCWPYFLGTGWGLSVEGDPGISPLLELGLPLLADCLSLLVTAASAVNMAWLLATAAPVFGGWPCFLGCGWEGGVGGETCADKSATAYV
jgi:hypothetical protein